MNQLIVNYRVDPEVAAALLPAQIRPRIVNGHAVAGLVLGRDSAEHRLAVASGAHLLSSDTARLVTEERAGRVYASFTGAETVDVSVRPAHRWDSRLFGDARAAARFAGMVAAVPVTVDWVRSSVFDRLQATVDCALLLPDVPVAMGLAA
jgi:hypothetical protein